MLVSPSTQRTASITLDLPQPFGPTTPVRFDGNGRCVGSTKDLNPASLMPESRMRLEISGRPRRPSPRSEEHTSELQSLMRSSYAVFCLKKKKTTQLLFSITY